MTLLEPLPHVYPFRFVDRTVERTGDGSGRVRAAWTSNARMAGTGLARAVLPELLAQSALLLQGGDPEMGRSGFLAGISDFVIERSPDPGELIFIDVRIAGRFGPIVKFTGAITNGEGDPIASGAVTVRHGSAGGETALAR